MAHLTSQAYWDRSDYGRSSGAWRSWLPTSFAAAHYRAVVSRFLGAGTKVLEIGVAPGLDLIDLSRRLGLEPYGVDFSPAGVAAARRNFERAGYPPDRVMCADLFDAGFQDTHRGRYDAVVSAGFIEHFSSPAEPLDAHFSLLRPGGVAVVSVPNLSHVHRFLSEDVVRAHNLSVMSPDALIRAVGDRDILASGYLGGLFNLGLGSAKHPVVEGLRRMAYLGQRLTADQIQRVLLAWNVTFSSQRWSPTVYVVARAHDPATSGPGPS